MANTLIPVEERNLTPNEVELLDKRRSRGFMLMVISGQFAIIAIVLLLWMVQDLTYAPGWAHPICLLFCFLADCFGPQRAYGRICVAALRNSRAVIPSKRAGVLKRASRRKAAMADRIMVVAEQREGKLNRVSLETLAAAQAIGKETGWSVDVVLPGYHTAPGAGIGGAQG